MSKTQKSPNVKMRDVANIAGVSTMTVSRALRKDSPINEETRKRVLQVVRDLGYVPDLTAGSLSSRKTGFVPLLLPSLNNLHFAQTVQALTEELSKVDMQVLLGHTDYCSDKEEDLIELMLRRRPEAIIMCYDGHTDRTIELLQKADIPVIELWETPKKPIQHTVGFSNFDAAYKMTKTLIEQGYAKIGFIGESQETGTRAAARREGFMAAMQDAGLAAHRVVRHENLPLTISSGSDACEIMLERHPDVDCIFCVSDPAAFGVKSRLIERGFRVPDDIGLAGFGAFEISQFCHPPITTVGVDPWLLGKKAAELLLRVLQQKALGQSGDALTEHINMNVQLLMRGSTRSTIQKSDKERRVQ